MIAEIKFECAHCGQKMAVGSEAAGLDAECPTCQNLVTIPQDAAFSEPRRSDGGLREKLAALQSECERLGASATHAQAEIKSFQNERLTLRNEAAALKQRAIAAEEKLGLLEIVRQRLEATETQFAALERDLVESQTALAGATRERAATMEELKGVRTELAAAVASSKRAQSKTAATKARLAEARAALAAAQTELNAVQGRLTAETGEVESLRALVSCDDASRELLSTRSELAAAEEEVSIRRQQAAQLEADLKSAESERDRLETERIALHQRVAKAQKQADALSKDSLNADNAKLRELLERQSEELKVRFRELTRFRRAKLAFKIVWGMAALAALGLGYLFIKILPSINWPQ